MMYYDQMRDTYGFGDGDGIPRNAFVHRSLYLTALNHLAKGLGSNVRVVAYDRPGLHNTCMLSLVSVRTYDEIVNPTAGDNARVNGDEVEPDAAFTNAEIVASSLYLDGYVTLGGALKQNTQAALKELMAVELGRFNKKKG
jgi:hypothetical protein